MYNISVFVYLYVFFVCMFFFFKQKTAYEMRISDWSSDVCSSDLIGRAFVDRHCLAGAGRACAKDFRLVIAGEERLAGADHGCFEMLFEEQRRIARFGGGGAGGPPVFACRQARPVGAFRQRRAADPKGVERGGGALAPSGKHGKRG